MRGFILCTVALLSWPAFAQGASVLEETRPWPNGEVPYRFENSLLKLAGAKGKDCTGWRQWSEGQARKACRAMKAWSDATGVTFVSAQDMTGALVIKDGGARGGSWATVGYLIAGNRMQIDRVSSYGSVLHEFGHVLGLMHEHQRPDRDTYLAMEPVVADGLRNCRLPFSTVCGDIITNFRTVKIQMSSPYDPCSLMHYLQNQSPRHREDPRWARIFTLTDKGAASLKACLPQFAKLEPRCRKVGQKCAISRSDADIVRRFQAV